MDLSEARKQAWETRRKKYGKRGHSGTYRATGRCGECGRAQAMTYILVRLHVEGVLSEGQTAKATGLDRVEVRRIADAFAASERHSGMQKEGE